MPDPADPDIFWAKNRGPDKFWEISERPGRLEATVFVLYSKADLISLVPQSLTRR